MTPPPPRSTLFPYTTLFRSIAAPSAAADITSMAREKPCWASTWPAEVITSTKRARSEEHTSELQSHSDLVCRLLLEKKKNIVDRNIIHHHQTQNQRLTAADE